MLEQLVDNTELNRFEYPVEGGLAFVEYRRAAGSIALTHAKVPRELEGRGIASRMVRAVLDNIRAKGEKVIPQCSFVVAFLRRHAEYEDLIAR